MTLYPIFLKLEDRRVLIVGGGAVAEQKVEAVLRSARDVTVLAPAVSSRIRTWAEEGRLKHVSAEYRPGVGLARGYFLVIAATDSQAVNRAVYDEAKNSGALANAVDDPDYCSFYAPAVVERGDFQIAISTGGASPALAQQVRRELEKKYGPEYGPWIAWLRRARTLLRRALPPSDRRKELLHLLAHARPARLSDRKGEGDDHESGRSQEGRIANQAERSLERPSARRAEHDRQRRAADTPAGASGGRLD